MLKLTSAEFTLASSIDSDSFLCWRPDLTASCLYVLKGNVDDWFYLYYGSMAKDGLILPIKGSIAKVSDHHVWIDQEENLRGMQFKVHGNGTLELEKIIFDMFLLRAPVFAGKDVSPKAKPSRIKQLSDGYEIVHHPDGLPYITKIKLVGDFDPLQSNNTESDSDFVPNKLFFAGDVSITICSNYSYQGAQIDELFKESDTNREAKLLLTVLSEKIVNSDGRRVLFLGAGLNHFAHPFSRDTLHSMLMLFIGDQLKPEAIEDLIRGLLKYVYKPGNSFTPKRIEEDLKPGTVFHELFSRTHACEMLEQDGLDSSTLGWDYLPSYGMQDTTPLLVLAYFIVFGADFSKLEAQELESFKLAIDCVISSVEHVTHPEISALLNRSSDNSSSNDELRSKIIPILPRFLLNYDFGLVGDWRDSSNGHGNEKQPVSFNVILFIRLALKKVYETKAFGYSEKTGPIVSALKLIEELFWVKIDYNDANPAFKEATNRLGFRDYQSDWFYSVRFPALSIGSSGNLVKVVNSDISFLLLYDDEISDLKLTSILDLLIEEFPKGLYTPYGWVVANTAYADIIHKDAMPRGSYHGDGTIWIWQFLMILMGLKRQRRRDNQPMLDSKLDICLKKGEVALANLREKGLLTAELFNWKLDSNGDFEPIPYAQKFEDGVIGVQSCKVQLWSLAASILSQN